MNHRSTSSTVARLVGLPLVLALLLGLGAAPAHAGRSVAKDPRGDLVGGGSGGIDLARIVVRTTNKKRRINLTFRLHSRVPDSRLARPGGMAVEFITGKHRVRAVKITRRGGALRGELCTYNLRQELPQPKNCSRHKVRRPGKRVYRVVVPRKRVKKGAKVLRWYANSMDIAQGAPVLDPVGSPDKPFRLKL